MIQKDIAELIEETRFSPFVIVLIDGYALAIGPEERKHMLVAKRQIVIMNGEGDIIHIPYQSISHIDEISN
jgi:hypothetical protein